MPFYYNWDPKQNDRYICRRLLERYGDLRKDNDAYARSKDRKAADYVELFSRAVRLVCVLLFDCFCNDCFSVFFLVGESTLQ